MAVAEKNHAKHNSKVPTMESKVKEEISQRQCCAHKERARRKVVVDTLENFGNVLG